MKRGTAVMFGLAALGLLAGTAVLAQDGHGGRAGHGAGAAPAAEQICAACGTHKAEGETLAKVVEQLREARSAAEGEGAKKTLAKLDAALATVERRQHAVHAAAKEHSAQAHPGAQVPECPHCAGSDERSAKTPANSKCPMMGGKVDPSKTSGDLVREFEGKTVGFCCGGCPGKWDRLSDSQKRERLSKVTESGGSGSSGSKIGGCCGD